MFVCGLAVYTLGGGSAKKPNGQDVTELVVTCPEGYQYRFKTTAGQEMEFLSSERISDRYPPKEPTFTWQQYGPGYTSTIDVDFSNDMPIVKTTFQKVGKELKQKYWVFT